MTRIIEVNTLEEAKAAVVAAEQDGRHYIVSFNKETTIRERLRNKPPTLLVADFDDTLARRQWTAVRAALPPEFLALDKIFLDGFYQGMRGETAVEHAVYDVAWLTNSASFMAALHFTRERVEELGTGLALRPGAPELFQSFDRRLVVSYGMRPVINACLTRHGLSAEVAAAELLFHADRVVGVDPRTVVTGGTKGLAVETYLKKNPSHSMNNILAIGDDPVVDRRLWHGNSFNVLVAPWDGQKNGPAKIDRLEPDDLTQHALALIVSDLETFNALHVECTR